MVFYILFKGGPFFGISPISKTLVFLFYFYPGLQTANFAMVADVVVAAAIKSFFDVIFESFERLTLIGLMIFVTSWIRTHLL